MAQPGGIRDCRVARQHGRSRGAEMMRGGPSDGGVERAIYGLRAVSRSG